MRSALTVYKVAWTRLRTEINSGVKTSYGKNELDKLMTEVFEKAIDEETERED